MHIYYKLTGRYQREREGKVIGTLKQDINKSRRYDGEKLEIILEPKFK